MLRNVIKRNFSIQSEFYPHSTIKVISRNAKEQLKSEIQDPIEKPADLKVPESEKQENVFRRNEVDIQMIPGSLYQQIFGNINSHPLIDKETIGE